LGSRGKRFDGEKELFRIERWRDFERFRLLKHREVGRLQSLGIINEFEGKNRTIGHGDHGQSPKLGQRCVIIEARSELSLPIKTVVDRVINPSTTTARRTAEADIDTGNAKMVEEDSEIGARSKKADLLIPVIADCSISIRHWDLKGKLTNQSGKTWSSRSVKLVSSNTRISVDVSDSMLRKEGGIRFTEGSRAEKSILLAVPRAKDNVASWSPALLVDSAKTSSDFKKNSGARSFKIESVETAHSAVARTCVVGAVNPSISVISNVDGVVGRLSGRDFAKNVPNRSDSEIHHSVNVDDHGARTDMIGVLQAADPRLRCNGAAQRSERIHEARTNPPMFAMIGSTSL
jgi:hypothetical protein